MATLPLVALLNRTFSSIRFIRLRAFDISTAEGRSKERYRRAAITTVASSLARFFSIVASLISVPLTLHYLGAEQYGMWMTMSSLVSMLAFADLGIGNGLLSSIASASASPDSQKIKELVSSGLFVLTLLSLVVLAAFVGIYHSVHWAAIFNVAAPSARLAAGPSIAALTLCFALAMPLGVVQRVQQGLQEGFLSNGWQCVSTVFTLFCLLLAIISKGGLPWLVLAFAGSPLVVSLINTIHYFVWLKPSASPSTRCVSLGAMRELTRAGMLFFVLQLTSLIMYSSDNIVITQLLGPKEVASYVVPQRLFALIPILCSLALAPLWPAYGEAIAKGDYNWVSTALKRSLIASLLFAGVSSLLLVLFAPSLIRLWVGSVSGSPTTILLLGLGLWQVIQAGGSAAAMLLNGAHVVRFQVIVGATTCVVSVILKLFLVRTIGIPGAIWSSVIAYTLCAAVPISLKVSSITRKMNLS